MDRKSFLGALAAPVVLPWVPKQTRYPLPRLQGRSGPTFSLHAREAVVDYGAEAARHWTLDGTAPGPLLRLRRGQTVRLDLTNGLAEPTILHWHGLDVPEAADGHPRLAIDPGASYRYDFTVHDPAGLYWYHPHTHGRTAAQTYLGMTGLILIEDDDDPIQLSPGAQELPIVLQDKRLGNGVELEYAPRMGPDRMYGFLGDRAFGNGVADPTVTLAPGVHRLRVLNASNARVFDLGLSDGTPMTLIGSDGGLLPNAAQAHRVMVATGERVDLLVDLSGHRPGQRLVLRSFDFEVPGMMGMMGRGMGRGRMGRGRMGMMGGLPQGASLDLLEIIVDGERLQAPRPLPQQLRSLPTPSVTDTSPRRTFRFQSMMMNHTINGRVFEMDRVDAQVRLGQTEVWTLINESGIPHPVHIHGGQHRILSRRGGRGVVMPWEAGLKDTVLLFPEEEVDVAVRFDRHPGLFLLHCHNLEHEDAGMMLNFEVVE